MTRFAGARRMAGAAVAVMFVASACGSAATSAPATPATAAPATAAPSTAPTENKTIGMVVPTLNNPFFVTVADAAKKTAEAAGYTVTTLDAEMTPVSSSRRHRI